MINLFSHELLSYYIARTSSKETITFSKIPKWLSSGLFLFSVWGLGIHRIKTRRSNEPKETPTCLLRWWVVYRTVALCYFISLWWARSVWPCQQLPITKLLALQLFHFNLMTEKTGTIAWHPYSHLLWTCTLLSPSLYFSSFFVSPPCSRCWIDGAMPWPKDASSSRILQQNHRTVSTQHKPLTTFYDFACL